MNMFTRLFFVFLGAVGFIIFLYGFLSSGKLSDGQNLMLWASVPGSLMLFVAACYTKECSNGVISLMLMLLGVFFVMLGFGIYKQNDEKVYAFFSMIGLSLCLSSVMMMVMDTIIPRTIFSRR